MTTCCTGCPPKWVTVNSPPASTLTRRKPRRSCLLSASQFGDLRASPAHASQVGQALPCYARPPQSETHETSRLDSRDVTPKRRIGTRRTGRKTDPETRPQAVSSRTAEPSHQVRYESISSNLPSAGTDASLGQTVSSVDALEPPHQSTSLKTESVWSS